MRYFLVISFCSRLMPCRDHIFAMYLRAHVPSEPIVLTLPGLWHPEAVSAKSGTSHVSAIDLVVTSQRDRFCEAGCPESGSVQHSCFSGLWSKLA